MSSPQLHAHARQFDAIRQRRRALTWLLGASALPLAGCGGGSSSEDAADVFTNGSSGTCSVIPAETAGPYPGDGTNTVSGSTVNALALSGIVRSDIRSSLPASLGTAAGVPLTLTMQLLNTNASCASLAGYAVYLWHCDRDGNYSMYSAGVTNQNYLRGVQVSDSDGVVVFDTVFPGCYAGRWPHMHFEIFASLAQATSGNNDIRTSQLALPETACREVYASTGYSASLGNLNGISLSSDNVFSDGSSLQLAALSGSVSNGYEATLSVGIAA